MTAVLAAGVVTAYCWAPVCRTQRTWKRALPTSPVYACTSCERTREFSADAPGSASGGGAAPPAALPLRPKTTPVAQPRRAFAAAATPPRQRAATTNHKEKSTMAVTPKPSRRSALQIALEKAAAAGSAVLKDRIEILEAQLSGLKGAKVMSEDDIGRIAAFVAHKVLEKELPGLMAGFLLEQLGGAPKSASPAAAKASPASADPNGCRHKNNMSKCASCRAKREAKG